MADSNIYMWGEQQPSVLLIHMDSSENVGIEVLTETIELIKEVFPQDDTSPSNAHLKNLLVAIVNSDEPTVSRKGLLNMAAFAAPMYKVDRVRFGTGEGSSYLERGISFRHT